MCTTDARSPLSEYSKQAKLLSKEPWYHYGLSREDAEKCVRRNGEFLVRNSTRTPGDFVLTYKWNGKVVHVLVRQREQKSGFLYSFGVLEFPSVAQLVRYHWTNQLPMSVSSEAVIYRPVNYSGVKHDQGLPWKIGLNSLTTHSENSSLKAPPISHSISKFNGFAGSFADVRDPNFSGQPEPNLKRASLLDLRGTTYADPMLFGDDIDYCPPEMLTGSLGSLQMRSSQNSLFDSSGIMTQSSELLNVRNLGLMGVDPGRRNSSELNGVDEWKPISLTRKGIRYVDMHEPNEEQRTKPTSLEQLPPIHPSTSDTTYHSINYDLTRALPPLLLRRTGPVERALDRKVWLELTNLLEKRIFSPLDYAAHLTLELISMLLPTGALDDPDRQVKLGLLEAKNRKLRRDLYNRDRFLRLFIIATVLMSDKETTRANTLSYWFELAQCLITIYRDRHTLSTVLRAIFSSKIPLTVWSDIKTSSNSKSAIIQELSAYHQALGGHILPEKHVPEPSIRSSVTSAIARLSSTRPYDLHNQIPNLHPLLTGSVTDSSRVICVPSGLTTSRPEPDTPNSVLPSEITETYLVRDLWMWELYSTMKDTNSLAACLSRTETILALLLGPIKLERGPVLDKLYAKLSSVLTAVCKMIESGSQ